MIKAQAIKQFGDCSVFEMIEISKPSVRPGHVLIRVLAPSVNPVDYKLSAGKLPQIAPAFPAILHGDVAGVVEEVGTDTTEAINYRVESVEDYVERITNGKGVDIVIDTVSFYVAC